MYNTEVICTYNTDSIFLETDELNDNDKEFIRDAIYRQEFLDILGVESYDEIEIDNAISELYNLLKECIELEKIFQNIANSYSSKSSIFGLILLLSFDYMYLTHICICEYINTGKVSNTNILNLHKAIS